MQIHSLSILTGLVTVYSLLSGVPLNAQIVPDRTLSSESSVVTPNVNIRGINSNRIDGGAVRGGNLFHSFEEFNVDVGRGAYFSNPDNIINILTRVTGGNISEILGTLGVLGNANLFLINPNGIVFGPNARLDVGGSFFATTADGILFENGIEFAASNPQAPPLLTINMPLGLNIRENPGTIVNQSLPQIVNSNDEIPNLLPSGLYVPPEETIALIGGEVRFESGVIASPGSHLELGGLAEPGIVELNLDGSLNFPLNVQRANISLRNGAIADVVGNPGGSIVVNARNLEITGGSQVINGVVEVSNFLGVAERENLEAEVPQAGDIHINATESVILRDQNSAIANQVFSDSTGNAGNINIQTNVLSMVDGTLISTSTFGNGDGGNLAITATEVELLGGQFPSSLEASVSPEAIGNGGNLIIETQLLLLQNRALVATATFGNGDAGNLTVRAEDIDLNDSSLILLVVGPESAGNTGTLTLDTQNLLIQDGAFISTETFSQENAGSINIRASGMVSLVGGEIGSSTDADATGRGGDITIEAASVSITDGNILVDTEGTGNSGNLLIQATDRVTLTGESLVLTDVGENATGQAGNITVETGRLEILDGSSISALSQGLSDGGNLTVNANEIELAGISADGETNSSLRTGVVSAATGNPGNININTRQLRVLDGASIGVGAIEESNGNAGQIAINAYEFIELRGVDSSISAFTSGRADAGNININTDRLSILGGGRISSSASEGSSGNAGEIMINTSNSLDLRGTGSTIFASTNGAGEAGSIRINTRQLSILERAFIGASVLESGNSNAGEIEINASEFVELRGEQSSLLAGTFGNGDAGDININTQQLNVFDGAVIRASTLEQSSGNAGQIQISATDSVTLRGEQSSVVAETNNRGEAGNINIITRQLKVLDGANIGVSALEQSSGNAGQVEINASEFVEVSSADSVISAITSGSGNAGNINITTARLNVLDRANIVVSTSENSNGNAGEIEINASDLVELNDDSIIAAGTFSSGDAGSVNITTRQLSVFNTARIGVTTSEGSSGNAGEIEINASDLVELSNEGLITAGTFGRGNAGNVSITTPQLQLRNQSFVNVSSESVGIPGNINILAQETFLNNQSQLNASSESGQGGNIRVQSSDIRLFNRSTISATGSESGQTLEGNIDIEANLLLLLGGSRILTDASNPTGGSNITIRPLNGSDLAILQSQDSLISAAGELSIDDTLNFDPPEALEVTVVDPAELIAQDPCKQRGDSEFMITGRGGIAPNPTESVSAIEGLVEWESFLVEPITPQPNRSSQRRQQRTRKRDNNRENHPVDSRTIVPARGWIRTEQGQVILVSYDPTKMGVIRQPQHHPHQCNSQD